MIQRKKKRLSLLLLIGLMEATTIVVSTNVQASNKAESTEISEVAEQKSVIDEQAMTLVTEEKNINSESLSSEEEETEELEYSEGWTNASVNVRSGPSLDAEILEIFKYNTWVSYSQINEEWVQIEYGENIAYINAEYISETENPSLSPYTSLINNLSADEKYLLYQIAYAEAGNQSMNGQRAVIEVILNRVLSDRYPDTVYGVLSQSGQFATWRVRNIVKHNEQQEEALKLVCEEVPVLNLNYLIFSLGKTSYGKNYVKIDDQWFGTF